MTLNSDLKAGKEVLIKHWNVNYITVGLIIQHRFDIEDFAQGTYQGPINREFNEQGKDWPLAIDYPEPKKECDQCKGKDIGPYEYPCDECMRVEGKEDHWEKR